MEYFFTEKDAEAFANLGLNAIRLPVSDHLVAPTLATYVPLVYGLGRYGASPYDLRLRSLKADVVVWWVGDGLCRSITDIWRTT